MLKSQLADIPMKEVSNAMVIQFETYLKTGKKCCQNTVIRYMKCFKKIIHIGLSNGWIPKDPFANIKFREVEVIKDTLTVDEVMRMYKKVFDIPRLSKTRDIFVFCCFIFLAQIDMSLIFN